MRIDYRKLREQGWVVHADSEGVDIYSEGDIREVIDFFEEKYGLNRRNAIHMAEELHRVSVMNALETSSY